MTLCRRPGLRRRADRGREDSAAQPRSGRLCRALGAHPRPEVTGRMLIAGPRHLRLVLDEYAARCSQHRPRRARYLRPPDGGENITAPVSDLAAARIRRHEIGGGLIHE